MHFIKQHARVPWNRVALLAIFGALLFVSGLPAQDTRVPRQRRVGDDDRKPTSVAPHLAQASLGVPRTATSARYSAQSDFSTTMNPNGVWSYGYMTVLGGTFTRYTISSSSGFIGWFGPESGAPGDPPGFPLIGAGIIPNPPQIDLAPGSNTYSALRWTAPANGRWDVVGDFTGATGGSTDVHIFRNSVSLRDGLLNSVDNLPFSLVLNVREGDTIDFVAGPGPGGNPNSDGALTRVVIAPHLYDYTAIDYPGATTTQLAGINERGDVVGFYTDTAGNIHGFLYSRGKFSAIDYPGAVLTEARGINDLGEIVGLFDENSAQPSGFEHGFILRKGKFTRVDFPGAADTDILGINEQGAFAGAYDLGDLNTSLGFLTGHEHFTSFEVPGSAPLSTVAMGINDRGQVVGYSSDGANPDVLHGFLREGSNFTVIDYPGADLTSSNGINDRGDIVGRCNCIDSLPHGYLLVRGTFTVVDFPTVNSRTRARGINDRGQIVGLYQPVGALGSHGFIATPAP